MNTMTQPDKAASRAADEIVPKHEAGTVENRWRSVEVKKAAAVIAKEYAPLVEAAEKALPFVFGMSKQIGATPGNIDAERELRAALAQIRGGGR